MNETMEKVKHVEECVKRITRLWKNYRKRDDEIRGEVRSLLDSIGPEFSVIDLILNEDEGPLFIERGTDSPIIPEYFIQMLEDYAQRNEEEVG